MAHLLLILLKAGVGVIKDVLRLSKKRSDTFASHFIMNGGDVLSLQKALGHSTLAMTLKYAHLSPDHLNDVRKFAPKIKM
jgi:site-specific recombinase XerD